MFLWLAAAALPLVSATGPVNFQRRMVQECVTWFGDLSPNLAVTVSP
jgi:hypothetical protein